LGIQEGLRIYISGALQGSGDLRAAREKYEALARLLRQEGFAPYLPHMQTDPVLAKNLSSDQVFAQDLQVLSGCDAVVAFLDEPSLGVGAEIALAIQQGKPTIAACKSGSATSRFIEGLIASSTGCTIIRYSGLTDIVTGVMASLGQAGRECV
jgi:hypothetical protein